MCAGENRRDRRIACRFQRGDGLTRPSISRLKDFGMALELGDADARRRRRPHHMIERRCRQRIIALVRDQAAPQYVDRARRHRQQFLAKWHQHRRDEFEPTGQRRIIDVKGFSLRIAEMNHQIGAALEPMHRLKGGPNLVVHFGNPETETFDVDYAALPGRLELVAAMLMPFRKKLLPVAPSAVNVLWRSLVAHQRYDALAATPLDHVMRPPSPPGIGITEFERHTEIFQSAYGWARQAIAALEAAGDPSITAILAGTHPE